MLIPVFAGILSALRRVITRRVSLKVSTSFGCILVRCPVLNPYASAELMHTLKKHTGAQVDIQIFAFYDCRINLNDGSMP